MYVSITGKVSEIHLHAWLFSNSCGKVLNIVAISWSLDLRVTHTLKFLYLDLFNNTRFCTYRSHFSVQWSYPNDPQIVTPPLATL